MPVAVTTKSHLIRDCVHHAIRLQLFSAYDKDKCTVQTWAAARVEAKLRRDLLIRIESPSPTTSHSFVVVQHFGYYTFFHY